MARWPRPLPLPPHYPSTSLSVPLRAAFSHPLSLSPPSQRLPCARRPRCTASSHLRAVTHARHATPEPEGSPLCRSPSRRPSPSSASPTTRRRPPRASPPRPRPPATRCPRTGDGGPGGGPSALRVADPGICRPRRSRTRAAALEASRPKSVASITHACFCTPPAPCSTGSVAPCPHSGYPGADQGSQSCGGCDSIGATFLASHRTPEREVFGQSRRLRCCRVAHSSEKLPSHPSRSSPGFSRRLCSRASRRRGPGRQSVWDACALAPPSGSPQPRAPQRSSPASPCPPSGKYDSPWAFLGHVRMYASTAESSEIHF